MKVNIAWLDQHGYWQHYGQMNHLPNARKTAEMLAARKNRKVRLTSSDGTLLDIIV